MFSVCVNVVYNLCSDYYFDTCTYCDFFHRLFYLLDLLQSLICYSFPLFGMQLINLKHLCLIVVFL